MLPSVLAEQIQQGVIDFLRTTFPVATPAFKSLIDSITDRDTLRLSPPDILLTNYKMLVAQSFLRTGISSFRSINQNTQTQ